ncbi:MULTISPECIES: glycine betaine ABC transporter substrate-binding protein [Rothia]|uniref:ABC-type glycine betaine transport system substrate-binding domain-containing protein n=1 Tax=Rothia nasimurium TaxID=85336 RepID=A0A1Y1RSA0_9MICC|nr:MULTISPECIES: glycine betaine ABC transporter substrate-binding protein [Rothia]ORC24488.1 hypothetical protein A7979_09415 [Rothia nasimurium]
MRRTPWAACALIVTLTVGGCSSTAPQSGSTATPDASIGTLRIGTGLTPETRHAAYIYEAALEGAGYSVDVVETDPNRPSYFESMGIDPTSTAPPEATGTAPASDLVHITPDLSGDLLLYLTDNGKLSPTIIEGRREAAAASATSTVTSDTTTNPLPSPSATGLNVRGLSSNDIVSYVDRALPGTVELLNPSSATDRYGYVITQATAASHQLTTMSDLGSVCGELGLVAPANYDTNLSGASSLSDHYGCTPGAVRTVEGRDEQTEQLITGQTELAYMYSASAQISANNLLLLDDPEGTQLAQNIVPVTRAGELPQQVKDIINDVSADLDTDSLVRLNTLTSGDNPVSETDAAYFWLTTMRG